MKPWTICWALACLIGPALCQHNPLKDPHICGRPSTCKEGGKFKYKPGIQHHYEYSVNVTSLFQGTSKNESTLYITSDVVVEFLTQCDGLLTINNAKLSQTTITDDVQGETEETPEGEEGGNDEDENTEEPQQSESELFAEALTEFNLRFAFHDGIITEICPKSEEKNWVLNFKRGLLSLLHNTMKRFDLDHQAVEEDVKGKCKSFYKIQGSKETSLIIEKTKDLDSCESRSKLHSMVQSTPYKFRPIQQTVDLLKSTSYCELSIDHHIYNSISCTETHLFRPFSSKINSTQSQGGSSQAQSDPTHSQSDSTHPSPTHSGATTTVKQHLRLIEETLEPPSDQETIERRTSLLYDQAPSPKPTIGELRTSRDLIKKLCKMTTDDVQTEFSDVFTTFIHTARILNPPTLNALYSHSANICPTGRKHILDALPYLGSSASVALIKDAILKKEVPEATIVEWMVSLALIPWPDSSMMDSANELLSGRIGNSSVALAVGSLTHTYCKQNPGCQFETSVDGIIRLLEDGVGQAYKSQKVEGRQQNERDNQETMMVGLKSLANIGVVSDGMSGTLRDMIQDPSLDPGIRVAAVEVHRRLPCEETRPFFEKIFKGDSVFEGEDGGSTSTGSTFKGGSMDIEVRIASYLQVMRCPNFAVLRGILHALDAEEVNQVGSFVWSHLNNLLKSSIPTRVEIQGLLSDKDLKKKFSSDIRKFSHNFEGDIFFEEYNVGANYDSNLIFSPSSYIPKSAMVNLTVELFGESVNLLEVYGRVEGFEHYLESVFGPKGQFSSKNLQDQMPFPKMRWARSPTSGGGKDARGNGVDDYDLLESQIENLPNIPKEAFKDPKLSLGLKIFGNDLKYATFKGDGEIKEALNTLNPMQHINSILSGKEINYSKASMFLDCSYVVPSGAGLPLTLNAIGTSSINMKMFGELHAPDFMKTKEFDLKGYLKPSIAIDVVGTMSVDAFYLSTGIKLKTNMYTSSAIEGDVKIRGTELVSVKFSLPKQNTEIFGAKSELIVVKGSQEEHQEGLSKNKVSRRTCSWPAVEHTIGLNLCGGYQFANVTKREDAPYFILAGPSFVRVNIEKSDPSAKTYLLEYAWKKQETGSKITVTFDTPGSKLKRVLSANVTIDDTSRNLTLLVESTAGTVLAEGKFKNTDGEKYLKFDVAVNGKKSFETMVSLEQKPVKNGVLYSPKFHLGVNSERVAELEGSLKLVSKSGVVQCDVNLTFKTKRMNSKLFGYLLKSEASIGADLKLDYAFMDTKRQTVSWYFLLANRSRNQLVSILGNSVLEATAYPNVNFNATLTLKKSQGHVESKFHLISTPHLRENLKDDKKKITVDLSFTYRSLLNNTKFSALASVIRPLNNLELGGSFLWDMSGHDINVVTSVKYAKNKDIIVSVFLSHPRQTLEYVEGRLNVTVPGFVPMVLRAKIREKTFKDYLVEISATWFSGHKVDAKGIYQDRSTGKAADYHLKMLLKSPSFQEINSSLQFYRDDFEFKVDIKAEHEKDQYELFLKHRAASPLEVTSVARIKYKQRVYSVTSIISLREKREMLLEFHVDQLRDIHLGIWMHNNHQNRFATGFEVKWDANRDPNQKLMVTVDLAKPGPYKYEGDLIISYPGRTVNGVYRFLMKEGHFSTMARLSWSDEHSLAAQLILDYDFQKETFVKVTTQLITPFDEWKRTVLHGHYQHAGNMYNASGALSWQKIHKISVDLFGDYSSNGHDLNCELKAGISSTVPDVPSISGRVRHSHNSSKVDTHLKITYQPKFMEKFVEGDIAERLVGKEIMQQLIGKQGDQGVDQGVGQGEDQTDKVPAKPSKHLMEKQMMEKHLGKQLEKQVVEFTSKWEINEDSSGKNLTGTVTLISPYKGLSKGLLVSKIYVTKTRDIRGVADLDVDHKKFTGSVEAHFHRLSNCMLIFNVTTPVEEFAKITGRFGFSEEKRHAVAMLHYPRGEVGVEILFQVLSITNFDTKFALATPVEFLQEVLVVGKSKPDRVDFRMRWNKLMGGFSGIWHYVNLTNFEYVYKVYTPLDGYEENGVVAKLILTEGLDSELSMKLGESKAGVVVFGQTKPRILSEMGIKTQSIYLEKLSSAKRDDESNGDNDEDGDETDDQADYDDEEEEEENPISWRGKIAVDALIFPTLTAEVEIDQKGTLYFMSAILTLPEGKAHIQDAFDFQNVGYIKNNFVMATPYLEFQEITSDFQFELVMNEMYLIEGDFNYKNALVKKKEVWVSTGAKVLLTTNGFGEEVDYTTTIHMHTPLPSFPSLDIFGALKREDNLHFAQLSMKTLRSNISFLGHLEMDEALLETDVAFHVFSPSVTLPPIKIDFRKDFGGAENRIDFAIEIDEVSLGRIASDMTSSDSLGTTSSDTTSSDTTSLDTSGLKTTNIEIYKVQTAWKYDSPKNFKAKLEIVTPLEGLEKTKFGAEVATVDKNVMARGNLQFSPLDIRVNSSITNGKLNATALIDYNKKRTDIALQGRILPVDDNRLEFKGELITDKISYDVTGNVLTQDEVPLEMAFEVRPKKGGNPITVTYNFQPQPQGHAVKCHVRQGHNYGSLELHTTVKDMMDWNVRLHLDSNHPQYKTFVFHGKAETLKGSKRTLTILARTPLPKLENPKITASYLSKGTSNEADFSYSISDIKGTIQTVWTWVLREDMSVKLQGNYEAPTYRRKAAIEAFFNNPNKNFESMKVGGNVRLNDTWLMGTNLTFEKAGNQQTLIGNVDVPHPNRNTHTFTGQLKGLEEMKHIIYLVQYKTQAANLVYGSRGDVSFGDMEHINGSVDVEWAMNNLNTFLDWTYKENVTNMVWKLKAPKFKGETLTTKLQYQPWEEFHNVSCQVFFPGVKSVGKADIDFKEFSNMFGKVNITNPLKGVNYTHVHFFTITTALVNDRYVKVSWPTNNAVVNSTCRTSMGRSVLERNTKGLIVAEIPLQKRHRAVVDYTHSEKQQKSGGLATVTLDGDLILESKYNKLSESRAGHDKDVVHVEVKTKDQEKIWPIGIDYVHGSSYSSSGKGSNLPTFDSKNVHLYHLTDKTKLNVTGELNVTTTDSGQALTLMAVHSNRTVKVWTNYDVQDQVFKQNSKVELGPTAWLSYDLHLVNKTDDDSFEAQEVQMDVSYPRRNFTVIGSYNISEFAMTSEVSLEYDNDHRRIVQGQFDWKQDQSHPSRHEVELKFKHPSFKKNVSFLGEYSSTPKRLIDLGLTIDYSPNPKKKAKLRTIVENHSDSNVFNYTYSLNVTHFDTDLDLYARGGAFVASRLYHTRHAVDYARSYMPVKFGELSGLVDIDSYEVALKRNSTAKTAYFRSKYAGEFPVYTLNLSGIYGEDTNANGEFYLNYDEKLIRLELNKTEDGSQSLHIFGLIPDSRNAAFNIWRDYEEIRISDVSYYLRLNHSRLIVSKLAWRPELKDDCIWAIREAGLALYNDTIDMMDHWRHDMREETKYALKDIWDNALPDVEEFLEDFRDLKVIEEDFEEFKNFLNESYQQNEFYLKDIAWMGQWIVDELALRSHIESLPEIVNEIWEVMGESGKKLQKSILWILETIKTYYQNVTSFFNGLVQGESLDYLSEALNNIVEKYDNIIKDLHVSFIRYMEDLWRKTYAVLVDHWHKTLAALEPTFITLAHYVESFVWTTGNDFLDFLYIRQAEMMESPYFTRFTNFTHDLDKFYRDMTGNESFANGFKYANVIYNFLKEKYFQLVPFANELKQVVSEITQEVKEVANLPSINFLLAKIEEINAKFRWLCEYFGLEEKAHKFVTVVHLKLTDMKRTALEAENKYREAKTKFIFDPDDGVMYLEQKLPMSWHAFNETPKFEEIPEYRSIYEVQNYFTTSKMTFSNFYYDYKPYTEPSDWLPPFRGQALIAGSQYFVTFDRAFYDFRGDCTYLLASDFIDRNFSIAISYKKSEKSQKADAKGYEHELIVLVNKTAIHIDVFDNTVRYGKGNQTKLPVQIGSTFLTRESDIVTLESSSGFTLECNMKFKVCTLEVSGWYFGKTAGLWGTLNNEPSDDMVGSNEVAGKKKNAGLNGVEKDVESFANSWELSGKCRAPKRVIVGAKVVSDSIRSVCQMFFSHKVSPFQNCFPRVPSGPFLEMCLNSRTKEETCTAAVAYMNLCGYENTPMRIPEECVRCKLINGTKVPEGKFIQMEGDEVPQSADIVFIVEAKQCNHDLRNRRNMDMVIEHIEKELGALKLKQNRYSVVLFGGDGVYDWPRSVVMHDAVFTDHHKIPGYLENLPVGNGNTDIFGAITYATKMIFRPGVSKTFILIPCSHCYESDMKLDHAILNQLLLENDIKMHILMNDEFHFQKSRVSKILYGIDQNLAYTRKDADHFAGDASLRKQVRLPKSSLGICAPLAMEIQGSVFSAKKLEGSKSSNAKKVATVFGKRVAKSAVPSKCKSCECTAHNTGVSFMECLPCNFPTPGVPEFEFNEEDMLALMQSYEDLGN